MPKKFRVEFTINSKLEYSNLETDLVSKFENALNMDVSLDEDMSKDEFYDNIKEVEEGMREEIVKHLNSLAEKSNAENLTLNFNDVEPLSKDDITAVDEE